MSQDASATPPRTRLHVDAPLQAAVPVELDRARAHYLRDVLRRRPGDRVALFNARDGEWAAEIMELGKSRAVAMPLEQSRVPEAGPDLWLLFAPIKGGRIDYVAEKATELGTAVLWPVLTRRTDVARVNVERLRANAVEAAEQCERLDVPEVREPVRLDALLADWPPGRTLFVCAEAGPALPAAQAFASAEAGPAAILVGPEGGFDATELDVLRRHTTVIALSLGPRILRADTAAFAALACWQALRGDGSRRPSWRT